MKRLLVLLALSIPASLGTLLVSCAPVPTVQPADTELVYRLTPVGDLPITTAPEAAERGEHPPLVSGFADITGPDLRLKIGPWCVNECRPNRYGFIMLSFRPNEQRGSSIVIPILEGEPVAGLAVFDTGQGRSFEAAFGR